MTAGLPNGRVRDAGVLLGAWVVSLLLAGLLGWIGARGQPLEFAAEMSARRAARSQVTPGQAEAFWRALGAERVHYVWLYTPLAMLAVGVFAGATSRGRGRVLAILGAAPFAVAASPGSAVDLRRVAFCCLYLGVSLVGAAAGTRLAGRGR